MYKSTDLGNTWSDVTAELPKGVLDIKVDPGNTDIVYATTNINSTY